ncbi:anti-sigma factor domain-containing protein [Tateyamaria sp. syn59]|uniref:anti-sigma factor n=1 Tax=Tateyamaria sp. syn59 TaxID=2576942 RepID=UPI0011BF99DB|nr:anti-sigma factor [Tateyamaria sp. syn59]
MTEDTETRDDDGALAAEYVMGLLTAEERKAVELRLGRDAEFTAQVDAWQAYFAGLNEEYGTVHPPSRVKASIDKQLFAPKPVWRNWWSRTGLAVAMSLAVAMLGLLLLTMPGDTRLVAQLASSESAYSFSVSVDDRSGVVDIALTGGELALDRTFELWVIADDGVPRSVGTFDQAGQLPPLGAASLLEGTLLAVSLEPVGGSPTGAPTGPVLATGALEDA